MEVSGPGSVKEVFMGVEPEWLAKNVEATKHISHSLSCIEQPRLAGARTLKYRRVDTSPAPKSQNQKRCTNNRVHTDMNRLTCFAKQKTLCHRSYQVHGDKRT
ncbi:unnamed protein product [Ectocarpus sp. 12 AP-2014]